MDNWYLRKQKIAPPGAIFGKLWEINYQRRGYMVFA
jgi:hypothetical protein